MDIREILERKHAITVLITIYDNPGIVQMKLADKKVRGSTAKQERIREQIEAGLIRPDTDGGNWTAIRYFCTDRGAKIARMLIEIENGGDVGPTDHRAPSEAGHQVRS